MRFLSSRGQTPVLGFSDAVATGLAPDGGLYLPETLPNLSGELARFEKLNYAELCFEFFKHFATDIPQETLRAIIAQSYTKFSHPDIAPLVQLDERTYVLELFHGPTLAFKDFALQLLGNLYEHQCKVRHETINVLGATSGDTGSAAIHGLLGKPGTAIFILYPDGRTSPLQERQMACTGADNVFALCVDGTFDDAQAALKDVFGDQSFRTRHRLSAVNSINLARGLAQCVYYLSAWLRLPASARSNVEFVVPTGNFGNVLAGWMLQKMGVPIRGFKVATNQNDILYRLFTTGEYKLGAVHPSLAPSMDIQVASNFERFIYYTVGRDTARVREVMRTFRQTGAYRFENFDRDSFSASRCADAEIPGIIQRVYQKYGYVADPHTACGFKDLNADRVSVVLATASPAKFPDTILRAIGQEPTHPSLEALKARPLVKHPLKAEPQAIKAFIEAHAV
ncbi:MAG TPA: threonine synthase [Opitutaceae bacterium]|jgi:threonine synthase|nr:threonine synthase [Opitutaceae bacterium]HOG92023.1 threonine synthase [Opitutaceae bacterium]HOR25580.1 threonine synthase [Opitutaceae bacterium]HPK49897.1 threonine synthase [Opitutaceae bacterium]